MILNNHPCFFNKLFFSKCAVTLFLYLKSHGLSTDRFLYENGQISAHGPEIKPSPHFLDVAPSAVPVFVRTLEYLHRKVTMEMESAIG